jgi:predicted DNA-binding transcriptional regulator YafY
MNVLEIWDFRNWAARYVSERVWCPGQKITRRKDGSVRIRFKASSEVEVTSWILSFRSECTLVKPEWLVKRLGGTLRDMLVAHGFNPTETQSR